MKLKRRISSIAVMLVLFGAGSAAFAEGRVAVHADYNAPVSAPGFGSNVEFGAQYRFWGIFLMEGSVYTNLVYGADNAFNIAGIAPAGLFSGGVGMRVPLGSFAIEMAWNKLFTGYGDQGVYPFCDSYMIGVDLSLSESLSVRAYSTTLYNFSGRTAAGTAFSIAATQSPITMIGGGLKVYLF
jgi:hypothetical protein